MGSLGSQIKNVQNVLGLAKKGNSAFVSVAGAVGVAGFVFDRAKESNVVLTNEITEHYTEDGSPVQDHIARKPEEITLSGYVGEYKHIVSGKPSKLEQVTQKLTTLGSYLPPLSAGAKAIYKGLQGNNESAMLTEWVGSSASNTINTGLDVFKAYKNINMPGNDQQKAFLFFEALRNSNALFTVETPWRTYTDMAIKTLRAFQDEKTADITQFEVTMVKFRTVETGIIQQAQGRLAGQKAKTTFAGAIRSKTAAVMKVFGKVVG